MPTEKFLGTMAMQLIKQGRLNQEFSWLAHTDWDAFTNL